MLRIRKPSRNTTRVADFLAKHLTVILVNYPRPQKGVAARRAHHYLRGSYGVLVGFELAGGYAAGRAFIDALALFYHVTNIGDARSLVIHPASMQHSQRSPEEQAATGVTPGYVRLLVVIEHSDDILADLEQELDKVAKVKTPQAA